MIYLVDFENTGSLGFDGMCDLTEDDTIVLIYSEKAHTIDIEVIDFFTKAKCNIKYLKTKKTMPNYLDFHISTIVGAYMVQGDPVAIISKDKGYVSVIDYWKTDFLFKKPGVVQLAENIASVKKGVKKDNAPVPTNLTPIEPVVLEGVEDIEPLKEKKKPITSAAKREAKKRAAKEKAETKEVSVPEKEEPPVFKENINMVESTDIEIQRIMSMSKDLSMLRFNLINRFGRLEGERVFDEVSPGFKKKKR